jgi:hypothetical protein
MPQFDLLHIFREAMPTVVGAGVLSLFAALVRWGVIVDRGLNKSVQRLDELGKRLDDHHERIVVLEDGLDDVALRVRPR